MIALAFDRFKACAVIGGILVLGLLFFVIHSNAEAMASPIDVSFSSEAATARSQSVPASSHESSATSNQAAFPLNFERHTGDLDEMVKRQTIRALVLYSRTGFFYVNGRPEGIYYEALNAFQQFANQKLRDKKQHVQVTFIPVRPDQIEAALTQGVGDLIAFGLVVTPEREQRVAFSIPIETDVQQIVVTGKTFGPVSSLADLGGKKIFVNPLTTYSASLKNVNDSLRKQGKPAIQIQLADKSLMDEDLMEMVNAGLIPATVTITERAKLWSQSFPNITPYPNLVIGSEGQLAWAMRKNNPQLKDCWMNSLRHARLERRSAILWSGGICKTINSLRTRPLKLNLRSSMRPSPTSRNTRLSTASTT